MYTRSILIISLIVLVFPLLAEVPEKPAKPNKPAKPGKTQTTEVSPAQPLPETDEIPESWRIPESPIDRYVQLTEEELAEYRRFNWKFGRISGRGPNSQPILAYITKTQFRILSRFFNQQYEGGMRQASRYILHSCEMLYVDTDAFSVSVEDFEQRHLNEICPENKSEQTGHPENGFQRIVIHGTMYTIDRHDNNDYPIKVAPMSGLNVDELVFSRITFASLDGIESINVNKLRFRGCNVTATELLKLERLIKARPSVEIDVGLQKSSVCADNRVRDLFRKYPGIKYRCAPK